MGAARGALISAVLLAGAAGPALAQSSAVPEAGGQYVSADGTRTGDRAAAEATWRADGEFQADWGLDAINADAAYALGFTGRDIKLGVVDSGTWAGHSEFSKPGKLITVTSEGIRSIDDTYNPFKAGDVFRLDGGMPWFQGKRIESHGTHVGGTMAAQRDGKGMHGVAFDAVLMAANGEGLGPSSGYVDTLDPAIYALELDQLVAAGVRVINNSWGISPTTGLHLADVTGQYYGAPANKTIDAIERAARAGVVSVIAAGNDGNDAEPDAKGGLPWFRTDPQIERNLVTVANMGRKNILNNGSTACGYTKYWCVSAPGTGIYSAVVSGTSPETIKEGYGNKSGTSMAAPHVSGALGVLMQRFPYLDGGRVTDILKTTATDLGDPGVDALYGWGAIDLAKALDGPGQFLSRFEANLGSGVRDVWRNDISQAALDQRQTEEQAEIAAWATRKTALGLDNGIPDDLADTIAVGLKPGLVEGKRLLEAAIFANTPGNYTPAKLRAALAAARENPAGAALLVAYEKAHPGWTGPDSSPTDYADFIAAFGGDDAILALMVPNKVEAVKLEYLASEARVAALRARVYDAGLTKSGEGVLVLAGRNSYRGDTIVDGGQLIIAEGGRIVSASLVNSGGYLGVDGEAAGVTVNGGGALGVSPTGIAGDIRVNEAGLMKVASGGRVGDVLLDGGTASIDGRAGMTDVGGGRLGGTGHVAALAVAAGGAVAPGNSIGVLSVDGDASFAAGSSLVIESDAQGMMDRLAVGGTAVLDGGTVTLAAIGGDTPLSPTEALALVGKRQTVVTADGGITGRFAAAFPQYTFLGAALGYDANSVSIGIARNARSFADAGQTPNQKAVATGIEALGFGNGLHDAVVVTTDAGKLPAGYDSLSGETHASLAAVAVNDAGVVRDAMLRRMPHALTAVGTSQAENRTASGLVAWGQAIAGFAERDGSAGIAKVKTDSTGFVTGIDKSWEDRLNLGVAFGYLDTDANIARPGSHDSNVRSWHAGGYAGAAFGRARVRAGGSYGWYKTRMSRTAAVNGFGDSLSDRYKGRAWQLFGELGLGFELGALSFEPFANLTHVDYRSRPIAEAGGLAALSGRATQKVTMTTLGLRSAAKVLETADGRRGFARVNLGWRHDLDNDGARASLGFAGAPAQFTVEGAEPGKDLLVADLALDLPLTQSLDIGVAYGGQFSSAYEAHSVKATLQYRF